jgi:hypothetical protein
MDRFGVYASQRQPRGISATFTTAFIFDVGILEAEDGAATFNTSKLALGIAEVRVPKGGLTLGALST